MRRGQRQREEGGGRAERDRESALSYANRRRSQFREYLANVTQSVPGPHPPFIDECRRFLFASRASLCYAFLSNSTVLDIAVNKNRAWSRKNEQNKD